LTEVTPERFLQLQEQARCFTPDQLLKMLDILADAERDLRFTNQHRLLLERAFWSILPSRLGVSSAAAMPDVSAREAAAARVRAAVRSESAAEVPTSVPLEPAPAKRETEVAAPSAPTEEVGPLPPETAPRFAPTVDEEVVRRVWNRVRQRITRKSRAAAAIFGEEKVLRLEDRTIVLGFTEEFKRSRADRPQGRQLIEQMLEEELGVAGFKVRCVLMEEEPLGATAVAPDALGNEGADVAALNTPALGLLNEEPVESDTPSLSAAPPPQATPSESPAAAGRRKPKGSEEEFLTLVLEEFDGEMVDE
jgi:DNA polymerase-3 subunit gamma/tau